MSGRKIPKKDPIVDFISNARSQPVNRSFPHITRDQLNPKQKCVYDLVFNSVIEKESLRLVVAGAAGTGKSFIIFSLRPFLESKKIGFNIFSFTGASAFLIGGTTFHKGLSLGLGYKKNHPGKNLTFPARRLINCQVYIFDELSLIGLSLLGYIDLRLRAIHKCDDPFGGKTVILLGDYAQLPPVGDRTIYDRSTNLETKLDKSGQTAYASFNNCVILEDSMRQCGQDQLLFREILAKCRNGNCDDMVVKNIEKRYAENLEEEELLQFQNATYLFADREACTAYNNFRLEKLGEREEIISLVPNDSGKRTPPPQDIVHLCVGSRVYITRNLFTEAGLYNGALATVTEISKDLDNDGLPKFIFVKPDKYYGARFALRNDIPLVPIKYPAYDPVARKSFQRRMYPLALAYGLTVHKAQGATLDKVVLGIPSESNRSSLYFRLSPSIFYTAFGRARRLSDITSSQPFNRYLVDNPRSNHLLRWTEEVERLRGIERETLERIGFNSS